MKIWYGVIVMGIVFLGSTSRANNGECVPSVEQVFSCTPPTPFWMEIYAQLKGQSRTEKSNSAITTLDIKAIAEMELYAKKKNLAWVGRNLWEILPDHLSGTGNYSPRDHFLKTHQAWLDYVCQQTQFIADTSGGGSGYTLQIRSIHIAEMEWRIQLYQELLDGKNVIKHSLYFYDSVPAPGD